MKKINILMILTAVIFGLTACHNEAPFSSDRGDGKKGLCEFHKSALSFDVKDNDGASVVTRAGNPVIDDFKLVFKKNGEEVQSVIYGKMPEIILLEEGTYQITASYGADLEAEWENPYYVGESEEFSVTRNEITTDIKPIVCELKNVKVSVIFDPELSSAADEDSYIEVKVGNGKGLQFTKSETRNGYFRINDETTLVATYHGSVNGSEIKNETKTLSDIEGGIFYKVTFSLHSHNNSNHGDSDGSILVDASVNCENINNNIEVKDQLLEDQSERPSQEDPNQGPDEPEVYDGPVITAKAPLNLDDWNVVTDGMKCILVVKSYAEGGIKAFDVKIISDKLTPDELAGVGLSSNLDLVNPGATQEALEGLGFPVNVGGRTDEILFDITNFLPMMKVLGSADHIFKLIVSDANGDTEKELKLRIK